MVVQPLNTPHTLARAHTYVCTNSFFFFRSQGCKLYRALTQGIGNLRRFVSRFVCFFHFKNAAREQKKVH